MKYLLVILLTAVDEVRRRTIARNLAPSPLEILLGYYYCT